MHIAIYGILSQQKLISLAEAKKVALGTVKTFASIDFKTPHDCSPHPSISFRSAKPLKLFLEQSHGS